MACRTACKIETDDMRGSFAYFPDSARLRFAPTGCPLQRYLQGRFSDAEASGNALKPTLALAEKNAYPLRSPHGNSLEFQAAGPMR